MDKSTGATRVARRALASSVLAGGLLAASLALGTVPALAAYTAKVQNGTLVLTGDGASDKLAQRLDGAAPNMLQVDVGEEHLDIRTLGGTDTTTINDLTTTTVKTVDVNLNAPDGNGDGAPDTVVANGTESRDNVSVTRSGDDVLVSGLAADVRVTGSEVADDTLAIRTLGGDDNVTIDPSAALLITPVIDQGPDG